MTEPTVKVVNKLNGAIKEVEESQVALFLRKHTIYQILPEVKVEKEKPARKAAPKKVLKPQPKPNTKRPVNASPPSPSSAISGNPPASKKSKKDLSSVQESQVQSDADDDAEPGPATGSTGQMLVLSLEDVDEISRKYAELVAASLTGSIDWSVLAAETCGGKLTATDAELVATEYQSHIHFRPSLGVVVMERHEARGLSDYKRHKLTVKKIKQSVPAMVHQFQAAQAIKDEVPGESRAERALARIEAGDLSAAPIPPVDHRMQMDSLRRPGPGRPRKMPMSFPPAGPAPTGPQLATAEAEFVRDVLIAGEEWLDVMATVVTRESLSQMIIRAATQVFAQYLTFELKKTHASIIRS